MLQEDQNNFSTRVEADLYEAGRLAAQSHGHVTW